MQGDGPDTALARALHDSDALPLETIQQCLAEVRERNSAGGMATLAGLLLERQLLAPETLRVVGGGSSEGAGPALSPTKADVSSERLAIPHGVAIGEVLGGYRLVSELARGGMGAVFEATGPSGGRYAVKTVLLSGLGLEADPELLQRFQREGEIAAKLDHPNIVRVHMADFDSAVPFIVQDFMPGGTLQGRLRHGPLAEAEAVDIVVKLADALGHAHGRGVLHRDLKPDNVMQDETGEPKLVDFGIGLALEDSRLSKTGQLLGTPSYMAPEQALGLKDVDARTDVYGLGAVLYALLTGRAPFEGQAQLLVLSAVAKEPPVDPVQHNPRISRDVADACLRAMAKSKEDRFQDMAELAAALESASPSLGRRPLVPLVAGALALLLLIVGGVMLAAPDEPEPQPPPVVPDLAPAPKLEPAWVLKPGETYACQVDMGTDVLEEGRLIPFADMGMILEVTVGEVTPTRRVLNCKIVALRVLHSPIAAAGGVRFQYDSFGEVSVIDMSAAIGEDVTIVFAPDGHILSIVGLEEMNDKVLRPKLDEQFKVVRQGFPLVDNSISKLTNRLYENHLELLTHVVPPDGLGQKEPWTIEADISRPHLPEIKVRATLRPDGEVGRYSMIGTTKKADAEYSLVGQATFLEGHLEQSWFRERFTARTPDAFGKRMQSSGSFQWMKRPLDHWLESPGRGQ